MIDILFVLIVMLCCVLTSLFILWFVWKIGYEVKIIKTFALSLTISNVCLLLLALLIVNI